MGLAAGERLSHCTVILTRPRSVPSASRCIPKHNESNRDRPNLTHDGSSTKLLCRHYISIQASSTYLVCADNAGAAVIAPGCDRLKFHTRYSWYMPVEPTKKFTAARL